MCKWKGVIVVLVKSNEELWVHLCQKFTIAGTSGIVVLIQSLFIKLGKRVFT